MIVLTHEVPVILCASGLNKQSGRMLHACMHALLTDCTKAFKQRRKKSKEKSKEKR